VIRIEDVTSSKVDAFNRELLSFVAFISNLLKKDILINHIEMFSKINFIGRISQNLSFFEEEAKGTGPLASSFMHKFLY